MWLSPRASPGAGPCTWSVEPHEVPTDPLLSLSIFQHISFAICLQFPWELLKKDRHLQQQGLGCWGTCRSLQHIPWDREAVPKGNRISLGLCPFPPTPLGVWESCPRVDFCFPTPSMAGLGTTVSAASVKAGLSPGDGALQDQSPSLSGPEIETLSQQGCTNREKAVPLQEKNIFREILEEIPQGRNPLSLF